MGLFEFDFSFKFFYLLIYIIIIIVTRQLTFSTNLTSLFSFSNKTNIPIVISFMQLSGYILNYIRKKKTNEKLVPERKQTKTDEPRIFSNVSVIKNNENERFKKIKKKFYGIVLVCGICESYRYFYSIGLGEGKKDVGYYLCAFFLVEIMILSDGILDIKSYSHHYLSMILFFICDLLFSLKSTLETPSISKILFNFLGNLWSNKHDLLFSVLKLCLEKYIMHYLYVNPYFLIYYEGIVQIIFFSFINLYFFTKDFYFSEKKTFILEQMIFLKVVFSNLFLFLIYCFMIVLLKLLELFINESFEPSYLIVSSTSFIFIRYYEYFFEKLSDKPKYYYLLDITYNLGYTFGSFIFCEIFILNFWGLGKNTRKLTDKRQYRESAILMEDMNLIEISLNNL